MSRVWKVFANFAPDSVIDVRIASLRISSYWLSGSEIIILLMSCINYKGAGNQALSQIYLVVFC